MGSYHDRTIVAIIPARYNSSRFPGKVLHDIAGMAMIERVYKQASKFVGFAGVFAATESELVRSFCMSKGIPCLMTRPDHESGTDRIIEAAKSIDIAAIKPDIVINVQGDEPLLNPGIFYDLLLPFFQDESTKISTVMKKIENDEDLNNPGIVKVAVANTGKALYFSRSLIPYYRDPNTARKYYKHIGLYAFRTSILKVIGSLKASYLEGIEKLEQLRFLENGIPIHITETKFDSIAVDTPDDVKKVEDYLQNLSS